MGLATNLSGGAHAYQFIIGNTKVPLCYMPSQNPNSMNIINKKEFNRTQTIGGQAFEHWGEQPAIMEVTMRVRKNSFAGNLIGIYKEKKYDLEDPMLCTEMEILQAVYHLDRHPIKGTFGDLLNKAPLIGKKSAPVSTQKAVIKNSIVNVTTSSGGSIVGSGKDILLKNATFTMSDSASILPGTAIENDVSIGDRLNKVSDTIIFYKNELYSGFFQDLKIEEDGEHPFFNKVTFNFVITSTLRDYLYEVLASNQVGRIILGAIGTASAVQATTYLVDSLTKGADSLKGLI